MTEGRIDLQDRPAREVALSTGLGNGVKSSSTKLGVALEPDADPDPDPEAEAFPPSVPVIIDDIELRSDSSDTGVDMVQ